MTGAPGAGKSSLVGALRGARLTCMDEGGRAIIRAQVLVGGSALPWADKQAFAELMLAHDLRSYRAAEATEGPVVFDRGIPDVIGYRRLVDLTIPDSSAAAGRRFRYNRLAFIAPPWRDIFVQDAERKQDFEDAVSTFRAMTDVYTELGYTLVPLPLAPVAERAAFVRDPIRRVMGKEGLECI